MAQYPITRSSGPIHSVSTESEPPPKNGKSKSEIRKKCEKDDSCESVTKRNKYSSMSGVSACAAVASPPFHSLQSIPQIKISHALNSVNPRISSSSDVKLKSQLGRPRFGAATRGSIRTSVRCNSSTGPGSGGNESRDVFDAFFLGKALAEALNERVESTVGEFLSTIGRLQAEQQRQIQEFQEDVLQRAQKAKENAAREALEAQGTVPKSARANASAVSNGDAQATPPSTTNVSTPITISAARTGSCPDAEGSIAEVPIDD